MIDLHAHIFYDEHLGRPGKHGLVYRLTLPGHNKVAPGDYSRPTRAMPSLSSSAED